MAGYSVTYDITMKKKKGDFGMAPVITVKGHIIGKNGGNLSNVDVSCDSGDSTKTDINGNFNLPIHFIRNHDMVVHVTYSKDGYEPITKTYSTFELGKVYTEDNLTLFKKSAPVPSGSKTHEFLIQGHVKTESGSPISGVDVVVNDGNGDDKAKTDNNGFYKVTAHTSEVTNVHAEVTYSKDGYKTITKRYYASYMPKVMTGDVTMKPDVVEHKQTARLVGTVTARYHPGVPVEGAKVTLSPINKSTVTDFQGHFDFSKLNRGQNLTCVVTAQGYKAFTKKITLSNTDDSNILNVQLLRATAGFSGTVTDSNTGLPIEGAKVALSPLNKTTTTYSDGTWHFRNLDYGQSFTCVITAHGYKTFTKKITLSNTRDVNLLSVQLVPVTQQKSTATLSGKVMDLDTGEPIDGAKIVLSPVNKTVATDSNGHWSVSKLNRGQSLTCNITAQGYNAFTKKITLSSTTDTNILNVKLSHVKEVQSKPEKKNSGSDSTPNIMNYAENPADQQLTSNVPMYGENSTGQESKSDKTTYWLIGGIVAAGLIVYLIAKKGK